MSGVKRVLFRYLNYISGKPKTNMAKKNTKKVSKIKIKKKTWYKIQAPTLFASRHIGETYLANAQSAIGRVMTVNLKDLTDSFRDQSMYVTLKLENIKNSEKKFLHISTDEVYGSLTKESAKENFRFNPSSPYSATKAAAELLINAYQKTYDCNCMITRCTNNYGPNQFPEKFIPKSIILANLNKKIPIYGTGKNIRDWLFVDDHCDAISSVLEKGESGKSYNISGNNEIDNLTIVNKILSLMGKSTDLIEYVEDRPGHDFRYSMDSSLIRNEIGWKPKVEFEKGLEKTIQWYLDNKEWWQEYFNIILEDMPWKKES